MTHEKIKERYAKLDLSPAQPNRTNVYICMSTQCLNVMKTVDKHNGVTPMFVACEECGGNMGSTFYQDRAPHLKPSHEWVRPSLAETLAWDNGSNVGLAMIDHILKGGLELRRMKEDNE